MKLLTCQSIMKYIALELRTNLLRSGLHTGCLRRNTIQVLMHRQMIQTILSYYDFVSSSMYLQLHNITQTVNPTYSAFMDMRLERLHCHYNSARAPSLDDPDARTVNITLIHHRLMSDSRYASTHVTILNFFRKLVNITFQRSHSNSTWHTITVQLHRAERHDNRVFLVKTYHGVRSPGQRDADVPF